MNNLDKNNFEVEEEQEVNTGSGIDLVKALHLEVIKPKIMPDGRWVYPKELLDDWDW